MTRPDRAADRHSTKPKAVRMPGGLEARVKAALTADETVNGFIVAAIEERLARREGSSTTPPAPAAPVAPPAAPTFLAAEDDQPRQDGGGCKHPKRDRLKGRCTRCRTFVGFG